MTSLPKNLQVTGVSHPSILNDGFPKRDLLFTNTAPDLTENNKDGPYHSVTEYLDAHYDLLSEDFFGPIRKCMNDFEQRGCFDSSKTARMFKEVRFTSVSNERLQGKYWYVNCILNLMETDMKESKFGSLLLFMREKLDDIFLGKVISHKNNDDDDVIEVELKLPVKHTVNPGDLFINELCSSYFTMIKEDVFYYKYLHVLKVLNSLNEQSFPMKKYIVYGVQDTPVGHPLYLSEHTVFKIDSIKMESVPVLDFKKWPSCKTLDMDQSQFSALQAALSKELVVIHGSAGTGKTYFGVKLVKVLLDNISSWNVDNSTPILVVCQSNQALDHFMENLLRFNIDNIARIGNECQSGLVMSFSLKELVCKKYVTTSRSILKNIQILRQQIKGPHARHNTTSLREELKELENNLQDVWDKLPKKFRYSNSLKVLKSRYVVGLTSTAAAAHRQYLEELRAPIVIIEEAGEMLEAHTIVSMTEHCQHLILLGDLKQIKPVVNKFELGRDYNLNVSLFERLLSKGIVSGHCLTTQYRMRPEISFLLRPDIYKVLNDAPMALHRPNVRGLKKDVFFLDHREEELEVENQGIWNQHEVSMLINLAIYLVTCQKYASSDIAIITMYGEQRKRISEVIEKTCPDLLDVEVATVDGYQGRENEIVLLSLVRSNKGKNIGFLKEENRIYVALSRARSGLFIMGNMHCLQRNETWNEVRRCLEQNGQIGRALTLHCEEHQTCRQVSKIGDWATFKFCPSCSCETTKIGDTFDKSVIVEMPSDDIRLDPNRGIELEDWRIRNRRSCCVKLSWKIIFFQLFLVILTLSAFGFLGRLFLVRK